MDQYDLSDDERELAGLVREFAQGCDVALVPSDRLAGLAEAAISGDPVDDEDIAAEIAEPVESGSPPPAPFATRTKVCRKLCDGMAEDDDEFPRGVSDTLRLAFAGAIEVGPQQQVLGRIARERQLGRQKDIGTLRARNGIDDKFGIADQIADGRIELCDGDRD